MSRSSRSRCQCRLDPGSEVEHEQPSMATAPPSPLENGRSTPRGKLIQRELTSETSRFQRDALCHSNPVLPCTRSESTVVVNLIGLRSFRSREPALPCTRSDGPARSNCSRSRKTFWIWKSCSPSPVFWPGRESCLPMLKPCRYGGGDDLRAAQECK